MSTFKWSFFLRSFIILISIINVLTEKQIEENDLLLNISDKVNNTTPSRPKNQNKKTNKNVANKKAGTSLFLQPLLIIILVIAIMISVIIWGICLAFRGSGSALQIKRIKPNKLNKQIELTKLNKVPISDYNKKRNRIEENYLRVAQDENANLINRYNKFKYNKYNNKSILKLLSKN